MTWLKQNEEGMRKEIVKMMDDKEGVGGILKSDIEYEADVGHVRAGQILKDGN